MMQYFSFFEYFKSSQKFPAERTDVNSKTKRAVKELTKIGTDKRETKKEPPSNFHPKTVPSFFII